MKNPSALGVTILVVEDEPVILERIANRIRQAGYGVETALTRIDIMAALDAGRIGAIVLDLGLPGDDGIAIARAVRERSDVPILMLTGRAGVRSRVEGLEAGADDYLVKPFAPEELEARLRAMLRRASVAAPPAPKARTLVVGSARLDCANGVIIGPRGQAHLTSREVGLLLALSRSTGPLARKAAYREIFGREWDPTDRSLDVHIANLRRKLESACSEQAIIGTVRGAGYELQLPFSVESE